MLYATPTIWGRGVCVCVCVCRGEIVRGKEEGGTNKQKGEGEGVCVCWGVGGQCRYQRVGRLSI